MELLAELSPGQGSGLSTERIGLDAEPLQDGDEELRQRKLFHFHLAGPSSIRGNSRAHLIVFISVSELEISTVGEAELPATGGNDGIVAGEVEAAGSRAVHGERVVQHSAFAIRLSGRPLSFADRADVAGETSAENRRSSAPRP